VARPSSFNSFPYCFSWNSSKAKENKKKHGISFQEAASRIFDADALDWLDIKHSQFELRMKRIGCSFYLRVLIVVYTDRKSKNGKKTVRLISSRKATKKETKAYLEL